jgi:hypothetical protein
MNDTIEQIKEQGRGPRDDVVEIDVDCDADDFRRQALPFAVGYMGGTHGLTDVSFIDHAFTFKRHADAE